jgi:hypothetical protein
MWVPLHSHGALMALPGGAHWSNSQGAHSTSLTEMWSRVVILFLPSSYRIPNLMLPRPELVVEIFPLFTGLWIYMRAVGTPFLLSPSTDRTPITLPRNSIAVVGLVNESEVVAMLGLTLAIALEGWLVGIAVVCCAWVAGDSSSRSITH